MNSKYDVSEQDSSLTRLGYVLLHYTVDSPRCTPKELVQSITHGS